MGRGGAVRQRDLDIRVAIVGIVLGGIFYVSHDAAVSYWLFGGGSLFALLALFSE